MPSKTIDQTNKTNLISAEPTQFSVERLRASCRKLFGVTTSTFDGAVYGFPEQDCTVEEMAAHIKKWQATPLLPAKEPKKREEK